MYLSPATPPKVDDRKLASGIYKNKSKYKELLLILHCNQNIWLCPTKSTSPATFGDGKCSTKFPAPYGVFMQVTNRWFPISCLCVATLGFLGGFPYKYYNQGWHCLAYGEIGLVWAHPPPQMGGGVAHLCSKSVKNCTRCCLITFLEGEQEGALLPVSIQSFHKDETASQIWLCVVTFPAKCSLKKS